jgi:hypothetical protein
MIKSSEVYVMIPFSDADFVGPEDRPKPELKWELTMYGWTVRTTVTVKDFMDSIAPGGITTGVRMAPKVEEHVVITVPSSPTAPKAHKVTLSPDHKSLRWSLYTALLPFAFPKVNENHKAVFPCRPGEYNGTKTLIIDVANYRVERITKDEEVAAAEDGDEKTVD